MKYIKPLLKFLSLTLLALLIPGAGLGLLTVAVAVTAHEGSELLAVANGLRVIRA